MKTRREFLACAAALVSSGAVVMAKPPADAVRMISVDIANDRDRSTYSVWIADPLGNRHLYHCTGDARSPQGAIGRYIKMLPRTP